MRAFGSACGIVVLALALPSMAGDAPELLGGAGARFSFTRPELRIYGEEGRLMVSVAGERAVGDGQTQKVLDVRFMMDVSERAGQPGGGVLAGRADVARYNADENTMLFQGGVSLDLYMGELRQITGGGHVGRPPVATLRVPYLRMRYDQQGTQPLQVRSRGRVWAIFRDARGATEVTGLGLDIDLHNRELGIGSDARVLISGSVLNGRGFVRDGENRPQREQGTAGAIISAARGVRLFGLQTQRQETAGDDQRPMLPAERIGFYGPVTVNEEALQLVAQNLQINTDAGRLASARAEQARIAVQLPTEAGAVPGGQVFAEAPLIRWELPPQPGSERSAGAVVLEGPAETPASYLYVPPAGAPRDQEVFAANERMVIDLKTGTLVWE